MAPGDGERLDDPGLCFVCGRRFHPETDDRPRGEPPRDPSYDSCPRVERAGQGARDEHRRPGAHPGQSDRTRWKLVDVPVCAT